MNTIFKIIGFLAQRMGFRCSSANSRAFIEGWFLGAGITVKKWMIQSKRYGRSGWSVALVIHTRSDFKYSLYRSEAGKMLSFGYGVICITHILDY